MCWQLPPVRIRVDGAGGRPLPNSRMAAGILLCRPLRSDAADRRFHLLTIRGWPSRWLIAICHIRHLHSVRIFFTRLRFSFDICSRSVLFISCSLVITSRLPSERICVPMASPTCNGRTTKLPSARPLMFGSRPRAQQLGFPRSDRQKSHRQSPPVTSGEDWFCSKHKRLVEQLPVDPPLIFGPPGCAGCSTVIAS